MIIRKKFDFEASHIVRNCTSERCKYSIHGHSFVVEAFFTANQLDNGQMIYDFGLLKNCIRDFFDSFDHSIIFWEKDDEEYINFIKESSFRHISLPVSISAEMLSLLFLKAVSFIMEKTKFNNKEGIIKVDSIIVHETKSGYAQSFLHDLDNPKFPAIDLNKIYFSKNICKDWKQKNWWYNLFQENYQIVNPMPEQQVANS